ncbi:electron transport complex subunit RsxG [Arsenophonus sp.]|uniref:electron transport complex subunit RsxG n=1 Tax=Arsenophonus sp. TaxID=1872640 RepID=UPI0028594921|nr:electron transport complex subunit RsxG [Arsenophonus sp.]MDR5617988.1 electron transport complex subunit RsxG [Arsenophonus sp.]
MLKSIRHHGLILAVFAAATTGLTAVVYTITKSTINNQLLIQQQKLFDQIIAPEFYDNNLTKECYLVSKNEALGSELPHHLYIARKEGKPIAAIIESIAPDGYSGAIKLLVAADFHGKVLGVRVTEHHETPGLGDKIDIRISNWINYFSGKKIDSEHSPHWAVKKDGGDFDQCTGATITPRAVINATKRAAWFIQSVPQKLSTYPACAN